MDKKERNKKVIEIYTNNNYDIDATVKIIEKIPELAAGFSGKSIRKSCIGILNTVTGLWRKLEKKPAKPKKDEPTKKELANIFCGLIDLPVSDIPTILNMRKKEIALLVQAMDDMGDIEEEHEKGVLTALTYLNKKEG